MDTPVRLNETPFIRALLDTHKWCCADHAEDPETFQTFQRLGLLVDNHDGTITITDGALEILARCQDVPHLMVRTALTTDVFQAFGAKGLRMQAALYNAAAQELEARDAGKEAASATLPPPA